MVNSQRNINISNIFPCFSSLNKRIFFLSNCIQLLFSHQIIEQYLYKKHKAAMTERPRFVFQEQQEEADEQIYNQPILPEQIKKNIQNQGKNIEDPKYTHKEQESKSKELKNYTRESSKMEKVTLPPIDSSQASPKKAGAKKQEANLIKPNPLFRADNQSPVPQSNQVFTMEPKKEVTAQFDPYKYVSYGKTKNTKTKAYDMILDGSKKQDKRRSRRRKQESQLFDSSKISLSTNELKDNIEKINHSDVNIKQIIEEEQLKNSYYLEIDKRFGINYFRPTFIITSKQKQVQLSARKQLCTLNSRFSIYEGAESEKKIIGYMIGSFGGIKFNIFKRNQVSEELVATIRYKAEITCRQTFRKITVYIKKEGIEGMKFPQSLKKQGRSLDQLYQQGEKDEIVKIITKQPIWKQHLQAYVQNFHGKSKMSSRKNIILVKQDDPSYEALLFCRQQLRKFYLQIAQPFTLLTSMGFILSSLDFKLLCE